MTSIVRRRDELYRRMDHRIREIEEEEEEFRRKEYGLERWWKFEKRWDVSIQSILVLFIRFNDLQGRESQY